MSSISRKVLLTNITIDGNFDDWAGSQTFPDATDDGSTVNWENVWVDGNGENLSFSYANVGDIDQSQLSLWNIYLDMDQQSTTGYNFELLGVIICCREKVCISTPVQGRIGHGII